MPIVKARVAAYVENRTSSGLYPTAGGLNDFEIDDGPNQISPRSAMTKAFDLRNERGPGLSEEFVSYFIGRPDGGPSVHFGFLLGVANDLGGPLKLSVRAVPPSGIPCKVSHSARGDFHEVTFILG